MGVQRRDGFFISIKEDRVLPPFMFEKRLSIKDRRRIWNSHGVKEGRQYIYMACRKPKCLWIKERRLVEDCRSLQVLIVTISIVHKIIWMVLTKSLAVIPHNHKNGTIQQALFLQMLVNTLNHMVQKI